MTPPLSASQSYDLNYQTGVSQKKKKIYQTGQEKARPFINTAVFSKDVIWQH